MKRVALTVFAIASLTVGASARADWSVSGGLEHFEWKESTTPEVKESGLRYTLGLNWTQDKASGWLAAYRGKYYIGDVDYDGSLLVSGVPISGDTHYRGISNEAQLLYRMPNSAVEFVGGVGWDSWERKLQAGQQEDYDIIYLRLGANFNNQAKQGFIASGGIKYPVYTEEDAHLTTAGADQNPTLHPGKDISLYGEVGYRFNPRWDLTGYYDSFRFSQSDVRNITIGGTPAAVYQPESKMDIFGLKVLYHF